MDFQLTEEQKLLQALARELAEHEFKPHAAEWDERREASFQEVAHKLANVNLLGMTIPQEYGGQGRPFVDFIIVLEEFARVSLVPTMAMISTSSGPVAIIMAVGSADQRRRYLPPLVRGQQRCALAMSEAEAGSAATDLETSAIPDGDDCVLNGTKLFVGGGGSDDLYVVFVRFDNIPGARGVGAIIVEKETPGFIFGRDANFMGTRTTSRRELIFQDCRVPKENVLVKQGEFGRLMNAFNAERVHNAAMTLGIAQGAYEEALRYSQERKQFGRELCDFQGIQWMLAEMAIKIDAARLLVYRAAVNAEHGLVPNMLETSIAKAFSSQMAIEVCDAALQIHGAYGYCVGTPIERMYRDVRGLAMATGTVQIHKNIIASQILGRRISQRKA